MAKKHCLTLGKAGDPVKSRKHKTEPPRATYLINMSFPDLNLAFISNSARARQKINI